MTNSSHHKKTVLLLFGGESTEHDVSIASAQNIYAALDLELITPVLGYIDRAGRWWHVDTVSKHDTPRKTLAPVLGECCVTTEQQKIAIDVLFPVLHGKNGEDGTIQSLAHLLHVPIVGCDVDGSLLCMDKPLAKQLLQTAGIPTVPGQTHQAGHMPDFADVARQLGPVVFVKPARQGSSVGVHKVQSAAEFTTAYEAAATYDDIILIETAVSDARELEVAVLESADGPRISVVGEVIPDREFYSYEAKYDDASTSQTVVPATINASTSERIQDLALQAFRVLRCRGLARVDFFLDGNGKIFLNEINTMPGFTGISMYPKLWEASGVPYTQLITELINRAA